MLTHQDRVANGAKIRELRLALGKTGRNGREVSRDRLAEMASEFLPEGSRRLSGETVRKIEVGIFRSSRPATMGAIAQALGVDVDELYVADSGDD